MNKKYPYLFLHLCDSQINEATLSLLKDSKDIHIYFDKVDFDLNMINSIINKQNSDSSQNVFIYCFTQIEVVQTIANGYKPHICVKGNNIFEDREKILKYLTPAYEFFWFPQPENIFLQEPAHIANWLAKLNNPICISLSEIFNPELANERGRIWLKAVQQLFNNPILKKEQDMLEDSFDENNIYVLQKNENTIMKNMVLGLFGDTTLSSIEDFKKFNSLTLMKTKDCMNCDYQDNCMERGIGYIIHKYKYQQCIGIKLLEKE